MLPIPVNDSEFDFAANRIQREFKRERNYLPSLPPPFNSKIAEACIVIGNAANNAKEFSDGCAKAWNSASFGKLPPKWQIVIRGAVINFGFAAIVAITTGFAKGDSTQDIIASAGLSGMERDCVVGCFETFGD